MAQPEFFDASARRRSVRLDIAVAVALAVILTTGWAITDWTRLSRMLLPDPDDMMRLAQVRDWLAGQGINDWTQYRMAPPLGAPMHWSRVNDLGIAALILLTEPFAGQAHAEFIAILVYPGMLLACAVFLSARIARRLWGPPAGPIAAVLTALAYPGTTVFLPGRIDHHALQVVLIQLLVLLLMRAPSRRDGFLAGVTTSISLVVGLETAPQVVVLIAVMATLWVARSSEEQPRLAGFAMGLGIGMFGFLAFLRPTYWPSQLCDAFTPASSAASLAAAAALAVLAAGTGRLRGWHSRVVAGAVLAIIAIGVTLSLFPSCLEGPYGAMDPFLRRYFIPFIDEANGLFRQPRLIRIIALGGMLTAATVAAVWMLLRDRSRWPVLMPITGVVGVSAAIMLFQVRGAYIGAPLGAAILAGLVVAARQRTTLQVPAVIAAWLISAGIGYFTVPAELERFFVPRGTTVDHPTSQVLCSMGDTWAQVDRYPAGVMMAGTSVAAYLVGATHHSTMGAGYHRNNVGNMAMYHFFLGAPDRSRAIARGWSVQYVAFCPGDFAEIDVTRNYPNSLAARLQRAEAIPWLEPLPLHDTPLRLYRVR